MNPKATLIRAGLLAVGLAIGTSAWAVGTAFSYQGQLRDNGVGVTGQCDFQFDLYAADSGGTALASHGSLGVSVGDGLFTTEIDFGAAVFDGSALWLETGVDCGGGATVLSPRQPILATPYALHAGSAESMDWSGLTGLSCSDGQVVQWNAGGGAWQCATPLSGDITGVTAGAGLSGGGTGGDVTLNVDIGTTTDTVAAGDHLHAPADITGILDDAQLSAKVAHVNVAETLAADWVNTANPWADNEVADALTISGGTVDNTPVGGATPAAGTFTDLNASQMGIGIDTPGQKLHLANGNFLIQGGGETALIFKRDITFSHEGSPTAVNPIFQMGRIIQAGDGDPELRFLYSDDNTTERAVFEFDKKGIVASIKPDDRGSHFEGFLSGTSEHPVFRLNSYPAMRLEMGDGTADPNGDVAIERSAADTLTLHTANNERMRIDATGNVGIGTDNPTEKLHIFGGNLKIEGGTLSMPVMTNAERDAIATPSEGVVIYNTDTHRLEFWNATEWRAIADNRAVPSTIIYTYGNISGHFGGIGSADSMCANSPEKPEGYTYYRALLSTNSPIQNIRDIVTGTAANRPVKSKSGARISENWGALWDEDIDMSLLQAGVVSTPFKWWTGSLVNGTVAAHTCNAWTTGDVGQVGDTDRPDYAWLDNGTPETCSQAFNLLLCVAWDD